MVTRHIGHALVFASSLLLGTPLSRAETPEIPGGELQIVDGEGKQVGACPLKHTDVEADIVGFVGRVTVKQTFYNPLDRKIEAVYVFPLPQDAAVDDMVMTVGDRRIVGQIKPREEAREIYERAKAAGHVAGLLDQERPNIFTQSVANIEPGVEVVIEISYSETLKYEDGFFEWVFPTVVGPRYIPGRPTSKIPPVPPELKGEVVELDRANVQEGREEPKGSGWSPDTDQVRDASRITPPVVRPGYRAGHDISLTVHIDAGMPIVDLTSVLHEIEAVGDDPRWATTILDQVLPPGLAEISLKSRKEIPNNDFILRYRLATDEIGDAFLVHRDDRGAFFTLILQPPRRIVPEQLVARELIFVLDTSGSMGGFPVQKAKQVMAKALDTMRPGDTFNLITFAGDTRILWDAPRPNTAANLAEAQAFLASRRGRGGTEMMKAINAALGGDHDSSRLRIVCFMTDGYVGNDFAIIGAVKRNAATTRVFSFGIGNSVNRFLLDGMAHAGRGEVEYVTLQGRADAAVERFHERILAPVLTDIEIDWADLPVGDVYPKRFPDLFSAKPLMIHGRLDGPAEGTVVLRGNTGAGAFERQITVTPPVDVPDGGSSDHPALASLWARAKVGHLMMQDMSALQSSTFPEELKNEITRLGIEYRLMTRFTSFVAVEEMTVTVGGEPVKITVPVEMPDGVSYEGVFGLSAGREITAACVSLASPPPARRMGVTRSVIGRRVKRARQRPGKRAISFDELDRIAAPQTPESKLAEPLRGLAGKVEKEGKDGNLTTNGVRVVAYKVGVMIYLRDTSVGTLEALKKLGFVQSGESKAIKMLIGTIDVRKLDDLTRLEAVIRVRPIERP